MAAAYTGMSRKRRLAESSDLQSTSVPGTQETEIGWKTQEGVNLGYSGTAA